MKKSNTDISFYHAFVYQGIVFFLPFRLGCDILHTSDQSRSDNSGDLQDDHSLQQAWRTAQSSSS